MKHKGIHAGTSLEHTLIVNKYILLMVITRNFAIKIIAPCYRNESYPIAAFVRLRQAPFNRIERLSVVNAIGALLPSCPPAFAYDVALQDNICNTLSQLIARTPVYRLDCLPDADAARLSFETTLARQ